MSLDAAQAHPGHQYFNMLLRMLVRARRRVSATFPNILEQSRTFSNIRAGDAVHDAGGVLQLGHVGKGRVLPLRAGHAHLHTLHIAHPPVRA